MKLFYCPECQEFKTYIEATVTIKEVSLLATAVHTFRTVNDQAYTVSPDALTDIVSVDCHEPVKLRKVDECPHDWHGGPLEQQCYLCLEWRQGHVVFD